MSIISEEDVIKFLAEVSTKISEVEEFSKLIKNGEISPTILTYATANYHATSCWLLKLYESEIIRDKGLQQEYKVVWSEWIIEASKEINENRIKSKFASQTEIEAKAIVDHKEEWKRWQTRLIISERSVSLYRRLTDNWKEVLQILIQLNANSRGEMKSLYAESLSRAESLKPQRVAKKVLY